ncbi:hypothetical protein GT346_15110, partial [Streptomyces sp. SID161]|nr:hypothetical protein [Streptomyces sp. SID161]
MKAVLRTRSLPALLLAVLALVLATAFAPGTRTDTGVSTIARALRASPVYVDPAARDQLSAADADTLAGRIKDANKPLFIAVLPAGYRTTNLFTDLRAATGITGLYGIRLGDRFDARADSSVMSATARQNLVTSVQGEDAKAQLTDFTDRALANMGGHAPKSWGGSSGGGASTTALITVGAVLVAGGAGAY